MNGLEFFLCHVPSHNPGLTRDVGHEIEMGSHDTFLTMIGIDLKPLPRQSESLSLQRLLYSGSEQANPDSTDEEKKTEMVRFSNLVMSVISGYRFLSCGSHLLAL